MFFILLFTKKLMKRSMRIQKLAKSCLLDLSNNRLLFQINCRKTSMVSDHVEL